MFAPGIECKIQLEKHFFTTAFALFIAIVVNNFGNFEPHMCSSECCRPENRL
jgi:hypothetical protein